MHNSNEPVLRISVASKRPNRSGEEVAGPSHTTRIPLRPGFDVTHWQFARMLERIIASGQDKGKISSYLTECSMSESEFKAHWHAVQKSISYGMLAETEIDPPSFPVFVEILERYRLANRHFLALIPAEQWSKDFANWDDCVILFTLQQSILLPNPIARSRQDAMAFAVSWFADLSSSKRSMKTQVYTEYRAALAEENKDRKARGELAFETLSSREFSRLIKLSAASETTHHG